MRLVIDLQACQSESRFRGIGRYSSALTRAILRQARNHDIWIALSELLPDPLPAIRAELSGLLPRERIVTYALHGPVSAENPANSWRARAAESMREYFLKGLGANVVHVSSLFEGWGQDVVTSIGAYPGAPATSVTLYDLIPYKHPNTYLPEPDNKNHYLRKIGWLKNAGRALAISAYSRKEAIELTGLDPTRVTNISSAAEPHFTKVELSEEFTSTLYKKYSIKPDFILCAPGGFDNRKNLPALIRAYASLPNELRQVHQLVLTGKHSNDSGILSLIHLANSLGLKENEIVLTNFISDQELVALYNLCALFVFPSLYEGFGLPVLEAMSCGAPTIASNATSIPEIIGRADAMFNPEDINSISRLMQKVLTNKSFTRQLSEYGATKAREFSWDNSARIALDALEDLHLETTQNHKIANGQTSIYQSIARIKTEVKPGKLDLIKAANRLSFYNHSSSEKQLLVDISVLSLYDNRTGIQRVARSILLSLLQSPPSGYIVRAIRFDGKRYRYASSFANKIGGAETGIYEDRPMDVARGDIFLGLDLSAQYTHSTANYLKRLNLLGVDLIFVVYDILYLQHPDWWEPPVQKSLADWFELTASIATSLICISRSVALEVRHWLDKSPPLRQEPLPIGFFHLGADIENSLPTTGLPDQSTAFLQSIKNTSAFLMVGILFPRKGHQQAISAFELLWQKGIDLCLVIVGRQGEKVENLVNRIQNHPMFGKKLFWLDNISDEYLEKVYEVSRAILVPSEAEGFGLPLIEAARHGKPIIARDIPVFREVAGEHASYFSGIEPQDLADILIEWLEKERLGQAPSSSGLVYQTWEQSAKQLVDVFLNNQWTSTWHPPSRE